MQQTRGRPGLHSKVLSTIKKEEILLLCIRYIDTCKFPSFFFFFFFLFHASFLVLARGQHGTSCTGRVVWFSGRRVQQLYYKGTWAGNALHLVLEF